MGQNAAHVRFGEPWPSGHRKQLLNLRFSQVSSRFKSLKHEFISQISPFFWFRFVFNGQVAYFNLDEVLPESYEFTYPNDSKLFNVAVSKSYLKKEEFFLKIALF
jgi:hypothetical protein